MRVLVLGASTDLVEIVKWNSPSYTLDGQDRLTINAAGKGPVRLILHLGVDTEENKSAPSDFTGDPDALLTWHSNIRASLINSPGATAVIRNWLDFGARGSR